MADLAWHFVGQTLDRCSSLPALDGSWMPHYLEQGSRFAPRGQTLFLARTNRECEAIERMGLGVHAKRDHRDPFAADSDRFADIWASGRAVISSVHGAKGSEADTVVCCLDFERDPGNAEEQRVNYVAVSRAKRRLVLAPRVEVGR